MTRRFAVLAAVLVAVNVFFWLASLGLAAGGLGGPLGFLFGPRLVRAEVVLDDGSVYDVYRGRIVAVSTDAIVLREAGGTIDRLQVDPGARVTLGGAPTPLTSLRRGFAATVVQPSSSAATFVIARRRG